MHEVLAEQYVNKSRAYEKASSDCHPLPGSQEQLTFALVEIARQRDELRKLLARAAMAYRKERPLRTADFHVHGCECLRCAMDDAEALFKMILST